MAKGQAGYSARGGGNMFMQEQHRSQAKALNNPAVYRTNPPFAQPIRHRIHVYSRKCLESEMVMRHQIFIVEDHPIIREIYVQMIQRAPDLEVWGQATTGAQALAKITRDIPDLVLLDIALPEMNGIEVLRRLLAEHPDLLVLVISGHNIGTAEVESALVQHEGVSEAAVVGYPDPKKNQGMYCFVTLKDHVKESEELRKDLIKSVRDIIGAHVYPDVIHFAPDLPKTRSGKIMRRILRKIVEPDVSNLGDISTLNDPGVVEELIKKCPRTKRS